MPRSGPRRCPRQPPYRVVSLAPPRTFGQPSHDRSRIDLHRQSRRDPTWTLVAAEPRRGLHVDDCQPSVRLDLVRQPDSRHARLEPVGDPGGVHDLRPRRDLARADRGVSRRSNRTALRRRRGGNPRRAVVGDQFRRRLALGSLPWRGRRWHRRRGGLRRVRRQCAQVVPRSARLGGGPNGDGLRRRVGADRVPDCKYDKVTGLRGDVLQVRYRAGRGGLSRRLVPQGTRRRLCVNSFHAGKKLRRDSHARAHPPRDAAHTRVLGDVRDVRDDGGGRTHRDGAVDADREGLRRRRVASQTVGCHAARAALCSVDESRLEWDQSAVLRLGVRSTRSRADDVHRVHTRGRGDPAAQPLRRKSDVVRAAHGARLLRVRRDL